MKNAKRAHDRILEAAVAKIPGQPPSEDALFKRDRSTVSLKPSQGKYVRALATELGVPLQFVFELAVEWLRVSEAEARRLLRTKVAYEIGPGGRP